MMAYTHFEAKAQARRDESAMNRRPIFLLTCLCFGFAFFYIPILSMIVFSFNKSRLATVWGGFSTEWYGKLFQNDQVIDAAMLSLEIAFVSATFATILGTMAGIALARFRRFRGRTLFSGLVTAPLIMPEVITGISLLMLFIVMAEWIGWPGSRGFTTITIAHITFSMTYVDDDRAVAAVVGMDISVEEAAHRSRLEAVAGAARHHVADHLARNRLGLAPRLHDLARRRGHHQLHHRARRDDASDPDLEQGQARRDAGHQRARDDHRARGRRRRRRCEPTSCTAWRRAASAIRKWRSRPTPRRMEYESDP